MSRKLLVIFVSLAVASHTYAQAPFPTIDSININNINAAVLVHGDMWWDPTTEQNHCNFPNGSAKNISFTSALWMSGYDAADTLHVAAQTYRQDGDDYWPGPLDAAGNLSYATSKAWDKIWKVNRSDIQYFQALATHDTINTPQAILTWPGVGNIYARGDSNAALPMVPGRFYAPFADLNMNGIYEPLLGEYPDVPGDQALWWVFSDNGPTHDQSMSTPLGVEIQAMAFAYSRGTLIDNVVYYNYRIINRGSNVLHDFRIGQFADMDLGYYDDDLIGFDSSHRMGVIYNGNNDDGGGAGSPVNAYGYQIPIAGVTMIKLPGDSASRYVPAGSFSYYNNDYSVIGNPIGGVQFNDYLRSQLRDGSHFTNDFTGPGHPSRGYGSGPNVNYVYPGDPSDSTQWSECISANTPGDRRFIITSNDFNMLPGSINDIVIALVTTNPDSLNGCPTTSFANIKIVADTAWQIYYNPLPPIPAAVTNVTATPAVFVYPNPAHSELVISGADLRSAGTSINVYNTIGQLMNVNIALHSDLATVDISHVPVGIYYLVYRNGSTVKNIKFVKD